MKYLALLSLLYVAFTVAQNDVDLYMEGEGCTGESKTCSDIPTDDCCGDEMTVYLSCEATSIDSPGSIETVAYSDQAGNDCAVQLGTDAACFSVEDDIATITGCGAQDRAVSKRGEPRIGGIDERNCTKRHIVDATTRQIGGFKYYLQRDSPEHATYVALPALEKPGFMMANAHKVRKLA